MYVLSLVTRCIICHWAQTSDYYFYIIYCVSQVLGGASRSYIDYSLCPCDNRYVFCLQYRM